VLIAVSDVPVAPVLVLMAAGVLVGIGGHLYGSRQIVGWGLFLVFLATAAMVVAGWLAYQDDPTDPRPPEDHQTPF
jgi:hypothetical protein